MSLLKKMCVHGEGANNEEEIHLGKTTSNVQQLSGINTVLYGKYFQGFI